MPSKYNLSKLPNELNKIMDNILAGMKCDNSFETETNATLSKTIKSRLIKVRKLLLQKFESKDINFKENINDIKLLYKLVMDTIIIFEEANIIFPNMVWSCVGISLQNLIVKLDKRKTKIESGYIVSNGEKYSQPDYFNNLYKYGSHI